MDIKPIARHEYENLIKNTQILSFNKQGTPKVFLNKNYQIIKLFRHKNVLCRWLHRRLKKFIRIAQKLKDRHFNTIFIQAAYYCSELDFDIAVYNWIDGTPLCEKTKLNHNILKHYASFLAKLHEANVYLRGSHAGNVLVQDNGEMILIDMSNTKFTMNMRRRAKNLHYMMNHHLAADSFFSYGQENFVTDYLEAANLSKRQKQKFSRHLHMLRLNKIKN